MTTGRINQVTIICLVDWHARQFSDRHTTGAALATVAIKGPTKQSLRVTPTELAPPRAFSQIGVARVLRDAEPQTRPGAKHRISICPLGFSLSPACRSSPE